MNKAAVVICALGLVQAVALALPPRSARAAPRHKCPGVKSLQRQGLLPKSLDAKTRHAKALNVQANLIQARAMAAHGALRFQRELDYWCVLITDRRFARHPRRTAWILRYSTRLSQHRFHGQAVRVLHSHFARWLRPGTSRITGRFGHRVRRVALLLARWRTRLARWAPHTKAKRRKRLYRQASRSADQALRRHLRYVNVVGGRRAMPGKPRSYRWPKLTVKQLRKSPRLTRVVLDLAEALTLAWECHRAVGITPKRAATLERISDGVIRLFPRLRSGVKVRRAAARALGWFDLRRSLARIKLPRYKPIRSQTPGGRHSLRPNRRRRTRQLLQSRRMVNHALQGLSELLTVELTRLQTLSMSLTFGQAQARVAARFGLLYERSAACVSHMRWPRPAANFVRVVGGYFQDPRAFQHKISQIVFGSPNNFSSASLVWATRAKHMYRKVASRVHHGLSATPWIQLARRRLASLSGKSAPRLARVANRAGPTALPLKEIDQLLKPITYPQPLTTAQLHATTRKRSRARPATPRPISGHQRRTRPAAGTRGLPPTYKRDLFTEARKRSRAVARLLRRAAADAKANHHNRTRKALQKAASLSPASRRVLVALGRVQLRLVDISGALRTAARLEVSGHDQAAEQLRTKLRKLVR